MNNAIEKNENVDMKERILLAAIEEFGQRGYEAGSTNVIVQNAGVSKGLLFHYFGSKKNLYLECVLHVLNTLSKYVFEDLDTDDTDMFSLLRKSLDIKLRFYKENPKYLGLADRAWTSGYRPELEARLPEHLRGYKAYGSHPIFIHVDRSRLKDGMQLDTVVEYTGLLLEACWLRFNTRYDANAEKIAQHMEEYLSEVDTILDLIKRGAYKE